MSLDPNAGDSHAARSSSWSTRMAFGPHAARYVPRRRKMDCAVAAVPRRLQRSGRIVLVISADYIILVVSYRLRRSDRNIAIVAEWSCCSDRVVAAASLRLCRSVCGVAIPTWWPWRSDRFQRGGHGVAIPAWRFRHGDRGRVIALKI